MSKRSLQDQRARIAQEAARIICEQGVSDFRLAKEKAAVNVGVHERRLLPRNTEIEAAVSERQRLFGGSRHGAHVRHLRETALKAMRMFERFRPRLVGAVLSGRATEHSDIRLHLFSDVVEEVDLFLRERGLPYELGEKRLRVGGSEAYRTYPAYHFMAGNVGIWAVVFPLREMGQPPRSPVNGAPMERAGPRQVETLLNDTSADADYLF